MKIKTILVFVELENGSLHQVITPDIKKQTYLPLLVDDDSGDLKVGPSVTEFAIRKDKES